jgi:uncharacterized phage protein gp47/JayE
MATLPTRSFSAIVQTISAGVQGRASALIDFSTGSPLRAIAEAVAGVGLWLQALALQIVQASRLSTASGSDVDSFVADFGLTRLGAAYATGYVTYSRFTAAATSPFVPVGATVQTADGTQTFTVIADTTNAAYSAGLGGFSMTASVATLVLLVHAVNAGPTANATAGTVTTMTSPIAGIDTVTNGSAFTGGKLAETDAALKSRFALFILGLSKGVLYGVQSALANLNVSIAYQVVDGYQYGGAASPGFFYCVVDDGSGTPSSPFLAAATTAVQAVKPLGVQFAVYAPVIVSANVGMTLTTAAGYTHSAVVAQVSSLLATNITGLGLGSGLSYGLLYAWAFGVAGVTDVQSVTLNSGTSDIAANPNNRIMPGTMSVS